VRRLGWLCEDTTFGGSRDNSFVKVYLEGAPRPAIRFFSRAPGSERVERGGTGENE
jgi:hypothetical protein